MSSEFILYNHLDCNQDNCVAEAAHVNIDPGVEFTEPDTDILRSMTFGGIYIQRT